MCQDKNGKDYDTYISSSDLAYISTCCLFNTWSGILYIHVTACHALVMSKVTHTVVGLSITPTDRVDFANMEIQYTQ